MAFQPLVMIGVGTMGQMIAAQLRQSDIYVFGTTRNPAKVATLSALGVQALDLTEHTMEDVACFAAGKNVLVTIPPDGHTDETIAPLFKHARNVIYISSTIVYGATRGQINEETQVPIPDNSYSLNRLAAENVWLSYGATVLRVPSFYGPGWGLHEQIKHDLFRLPGDGNRYVSSIHIADLTQCILSVFATGRAVSGEIFLLADEQPVKQKDLAQWLCDRLGKQLLSVPDAVCHFSLLADRAIDGSKLRDTFNISLKYPSWREGFAELLKETSSHPC